jgi:hypothetical protein
MWHYPMCRHYPMFRHYPMYCPIFLSSCSLHQGSFFGVRIRFLASEDGSLHKYTNQSQSLCILQLEKRTLVFTTPSDL